MIMRRISWILGGVVALYAAATGYLYVKQADIIFDKRFVADDHDWAFADGVEDVQLERPRALVHGAYHPGPNPGDALVIYFHGNAENLKASKKMAALFRQFGYGLLAAERRETGKSHGSLSQAELFDDAAAWYDYARGRWPNADIRVVGYSMGTAWSTALAAARPDVKDVVLFAPFNSLSTMAKHRTWYMPGFLLDAVIEFPLRSDLNILKADQARFRIYHGTADPTVPYEFGSRLQSNFNGDDSFITIEGADHWDVIWNEQTFADLQAAWGRGVTATAER